MSDRTPIEKLRIRSRNQFYSKETKADNLHGFIKLWCESPEFYREFVDCKYIKNELSLPRKELDKTWRYFKEYSGKLC